MTSPASGLIVESMAVAGREAIARVRQALERVRRIERLRLHGDLRQPPTT
jgi:hypothetical protein